MDERRQGRGRRPVDPAKPAQVLAWLAQAGYWIVRAVREFAG